MVRTPAPPAILRSICLPALLVLLGSLACVDHNPPGTTLFVFDGTSPSSVKVWNDVNKVYDAFNTPGAAVPAPDRTVTSQNVMGTITLGWGGMVEDSTRNRLYLVSPGWRFALSAGCIDPYAWTGVILPCSDSIGRVYPLTIAIGSMPSDLLPCSEAELDAVEEIGLELADDHVDLDQALARLGAALARPQPTPLAAVRPILRWSDATGTGALLALGAGGLIEAASLLPEARIGACLWHRAWGDKPATQLVAAGLPAPEAFASLVDRDLLRLGWTPIPGARA